MKKLAQKRISSRLVAYGFWVVILGVGFGCSTSQKNTKGPFQFVRESKFFGDNKVREFRHKNGLTILLSEDHSAPLASYMTWLRAGSRDELAGKTGLAHLFEHMMFRETKNLKNGEFAARLSELGAASNLNANTYTDRTSYFTSIPSVYLEELVKLEADRFQNLKISQDLLDNERGAVLGEYNMNRDKPYRRLFDELFSTAFEKSPYRVTTIGLKSDIESFSVKDCLDFYANYYATNNAALIVLGDFKEEQVLSWIDSYYGSYAPKQIQRTVYAIEPEQKQARSKNVEMPTNSEHFVIGFQAPSIFSADMPALLGLSAVLTAGQSSPLYKKLVDKQIVKSIQAYAFQFNLPGLFIFMGEMMDGKKTSEAVRIINEEVKKIQNGQLNEDDLIRAKNQYRLSNYLSLKESLTKGSLLGEAWASADGNYLRGVEIIQGLEKLTKADIQLVAKKYLVDARSTTVRVSPAREKEGNQ